MLRTARDDVENVKMKENDIKSSYLIMRQALGILGVLLAPSVLIFGWLFGHGNNPAGWYESISATYYTNAGLLFTGLMYATGIFLISYKGYDAWDDVICTLSGVFGLVLASFPVKIADSPEFVGLFGIPRDVSNVIHCTSALLFFTSLAVNICFNFTKGDSGEKKKLRNTIYWICGIIMAASCIGVLIFSVWRVWSTATIVFEFIALCAFGVAWLIKGHAIRCLND